MARPPVSRCRRPSADSCVRDARGPVVGRRWQTFSAPQRIGAARARNQLVEARRRVEIRTADLVHRELAELAIALELRLSEKLIARGLVREFRLALAVVVDVARLGFV